MKFDIEHESSDIVCDVRHKTCRDIGSMKLHQCVCTGEYAYCCDLCNKTFSNKWNLKVSQHVHAGEHPYHCDVCNKHSETQVN